MIRQEHAQASGSSSQRVSADFTAIPKTPNDKVGARASTRVFPHRVSAAFTARYETPLIRQDAHKYQFLPSTILC